jgi:hypothetical protein
MQETEDRATSKQIVQTSLSFDPHSREVPFHMLVIPLQSPTETILRLSRQGSFRCNPDDVGFKVSKGGNELALVCLSFCDEYIPGVEEEKTES